MYVLFAELQSGPDRAAPTMAHTHVRKRDKQKSEQPKITSDRMRYHAK